MIRAFVAIPLSEPVADRLDLLLPDLPGGRPVPPESMHITLAFLGDQSIEALEELHAGLAAIAPVRMKLHLDGIERFGRRQPRLVAAGLRAAPELVRLHRQVRSAARDAGITLPHERFRPHVTLMRFGAGLHPEQIAEIDRAAAAAAPEVRGTLEVTGFTLYRSTLAAGGPIYEPLARYPDDEGAVSDAG